MHALLIRALVELQRYPRAEEILVEMLSDKDAAGTTVRTALGLTQAMYDAKKDPAGPHRLWLAYQKRYGNPSTEITQGLAAIAYKLGTRQDAVAMLSDLAGKSPNNPGLQLHWPAGC